MGIHVDDIKKYSFYIFLLNFLLHEVPGDEKEIPDNDFYFEDSQSIYFIVIEWLHFQDKTRLFCEMWELVTCFAAESVKC